MVDEIREFKKEIDKLEKKESKSFFGRLREELKEERNKPIRLSPLNILYGAFAIGAFVLVVLLAFYVLSNIHLLNTDPCSLCEKAGNICVRSLGG